MKYNPDKHHHRSIRFKGYDYSRAGAYFVTICTRDRVCLFGDVVDGAMQLNDAGRMAHEEWNASTIRYPWIGLDTFIIMPNHIHGIIVINDPDAVGAGLVPAQNKADKLIHHRATTRVAPTVGDIIGAFKSVTTVLYARNVQQAGWPPFRGHLWQRNYYEHIIRDETSMTRIRQYILDNPLQWAFDRENPNAMDREIE